MVNGTINIAAPWIRHGLYSIWVTSLPSHSMNPMRKSRFESAPEDHQFPWEDPLESCSGCDDTEGNSLRKMAEGLGGVFFLIHWKWGFTNRKQIQVDVPNSNWWWTARGFAPWKLSNVFFSPASPSICLDDIGGCFSRSQLSQLGQQVFRWKAIGTGDVRFQVPPKVLWLQPMDP